MVFTITKLFYLLLLARSTVHSTPFGQESRHMVARIGGVDPPVRSSQKPGEANPPKHAVIPIHDLHDASPAQVSSFHIAGESYVVFCRSEQGAMSEIFKYNRSAQSFNLFQRLPTLGCHDINPFLGIHGQQMLCLASHRGGRQHPSASHDGDQQTKSNNYINILQYNGRGDNFVMFDMFQKANSVQCDTIIVPDKATKELTLMIVVTTEKGVSIYRMSSDGIISSDSEELEAYNVRDTETFYVDGVPHIGVGIGVCGASKRSNTYPQTKIWKWDFGLKKFVPSQTIPVPQSTSKSGQDTTPTCLEELEFFARDGESYLVAVYSGGHLSSTVLHKWNRQTSRFQVVQNLVHSNAVHDAEIFDINGETYLVLSHARESPGNLYVWDSTASEFQFKEILHNMDSKGVSDMKAFKISNKQFLAIARQDHNTIYRLTHDNNKHWDAATANVHRRESPDIHDIVRRAIATTLKASPGSTTINVTVHQHVSDNFQMGDGRHFFLYGAALGVFVLFLVVASCFCVCTIFFCLARQSPCSMHKRHWKHIVYHNPHSGREGVVADSDDDDTDDTDDIDIYRPDDGYEWKSVAKPHKKRRRHHHHRHHKRHRRHSEDIHAVPIASRKRKHSTAYDESEDSDSIAMYHDHARVRVIANDSDSESSSSSSSSWVSSEENESKWKKTSRDVPRYSDALRRDQGHHSEDPEEDFECKDRDEDNDKFAAFRPVVSNIPRETEDYGCQGEDDHYISPRTSPLKTTSAVYGQYRDRYYRHHRRKHRKGRRQHRVYRVYDDDVDDGGIIFLDGGSVTNPGFVADRSMSILKSDEELRRNAHESEGRSDEPHVLERAVSTDGLVEVTNEEDEQYCALMFVQRLRVSTDATVSTVDVAVVAADD